MMSTLIAFFTVTLMLAAGVVVVIFGTMVLVKVFRLIGRFIGHVIRFVLGMIKDTLRAVGAIVLAVVLSPLILLNVVIGRWSASAHFGRALKNEFKTVFVSLYRVAVGHPLKLIGLGGAMEGLEQRLPKVIAEAPGADKPSKKRVGMFDGYTIVGSLPGGGSGGKLYIAEPDELKLAGFSRRGVPDASQVVIKCFSLQDGSSLPQIVRESRALDAAKKLGLVLEHELTDERFFYAMPYVPGESLTTVTTRMHGLSTDEGLSDAYLAKALGYGADLLRVLNTYHHGGLWHKDVKPDNIIVDGHKAHLVDFGLVTPLRSAMTLTTHGTEYFRDPELVRQALRGAKVHQIDGTKFDVYAAGAVLFSVLENSFPAHGGLSQITKRCPDAVKWIVRRAMTDYDKRYASVAEMLRDLEVVQVAHDPFKVRPADLPSMSGRAIEMESEPDVFAGVPTPPPLPREDFAANANANGASANDAGPVTGPRPKLKVDRWWSGGYTAGPLVAGASIGAGGVKFAKAGTPKPPAMPDVPDTPVVPNRPVTPLDQRAKAADQVRSARARAAARRRSAQTRASAHRESRSRGPSPSGINGGVIAGLAVAFMLIVVVLGGFSLLVPAFDRVVSPTVSATISSDGTTIAIDRHNGAHTSGAVLATNAGVPVPASPPGVAAIDLSSLDGRRILVISELGSPLDPVVKTRIQELLGRVQAAGGQVIGDGAVLLDPKASEDATHVDLVAAVRSERGQRPLDSADLFPIMRRWLSNNDEVEMMVWLSTAGSNAKGIEYSIITPLTWTRGHVEDEVYSDLTQTLRDVAESL